MAKALTSYLSLSTLPLKPHSLSSRKILFIHKARFIYTPMSITYAKKKHKESSSSMVTTIEEEDEEEEEEEDDGDEEFLAFEDMRRWEMKKPIGFGEGKVYDTKVEERLLEEMEKERLAEIEAEKIKNKLEGSLSKKNDLQVKKDIIPTGPTVRLGNLPKKKNIHRNLQVAFKGFKGIVNISPAVIGNWKTRDPICKGFAFVEFVSDEAALRFVNTYSKQDILFGKVQKQISFDIIDPERLVKDNNQALAKPKINSKLSIKDSQSLAIPKLPNSNEAILQEKSTDTPIVTVIKEIDMHSNMYHINDANDNKIRERKSISQEKKQSTSNKKVVKKKSTRNAKSSLPGSTGRLQFKERSVLTDVFSKYGGKVASASG